jgi:tripartite-type tricarboxylate transporter receptor subunit TctC
MSSKVIRSLALLGVLLFTVSGCSKPAKQTEAPASKEWKPEKSITLVVPTSPGGAGDLLARTVEKVWSKYCNQSLVVVNKAGGSGIEGSTFVARAKADGYTLNAGYGSGWDLVSPHTSAPVEYDAFKDLMPIARLTMQPVFVLVPYDSEFKTMKDVIEWGKKNNKPITAAVGTATSSQNIVLKAIGKAAGVDITTVPHTGGGQAITTLIGKNTLIGAGHSSEIVAQIKDKRIRAIGIASNERDKTMPDVPTLKEEGIEVAAAGTMKGISAPIGTSPEIVKYYADLFKKISEDPDYVKTMADMMQPVNYQGPEEFGKTMKAEFENYKKMATDNGLLYKK